MPEIASIQGWQTQKRIGLLVIVTANLSLILCLILRFVPALNDAITDHPEYMRCIADGTARSVATKIGADFPVIMIRDETHDCQKEKHASTFEADDLYYVFRYSESLHSLCFLTYAKPMDGASRADSLILSQSSGQNYGRKLAAPVKVVPVGHFNISFPVSYLSLLHWRTKIDASSSGFAGNAEVHQCHSESLTVSSANISLDFWDLRAAVAQRHNRINTLLTYLILVSFLVISVSIPGTWILYEKFRQYCLPYGPSASLRAFLLEDLETVSIRTQRDYHFRQQRAAEQSRAASLLRRTKEAIRGRLGSLSNVLPDEQQRRRVQDCLAEDDPDKMNRLLHELDFRFGQKTPEERLAALLESLKEYCTPEEFDQCCAEAFAILAALGFRQARASVVKAHGQFRARFKELEKEEIKETN